MGAIKSLEDEVKLTRTSKSSTVLAAVRATNMPVKIDSGADRSFISLRCAEQAAVKEMQKVEAPEVGFAGNSKVDPLGMVSMLMRLHKHIVAVPFRLLVFQRS
eukprot:NODE_888_length_3426_cov_0.568380.p3 type:complete len:103 gc:universal NODE_888_length_3426_cov_0.568380:1171-1479(+)